MTALPIGLSSRNPPAWDHSRIYSTEQQSSSSSKGRVCVRPSRKSKTWTIGRRGTRRRSGPMVEARLFGPASFNSSKLRVMFLPSSTTAVAEEDGVYKQNPKMKEHEEPPRVYTLTHSDVTAQITLTVAREINGSQLGGWYSRLQRDEVVAEWRKTKGVLSLHVHCHISGGGNFLHSLIARLRFYIFQKELPVVLQAFMVGDRQLFWQNPTLKYAPVWVYFHSKALVFNRVEFWGPLIEAIRRCPQLPDEEEKGQEFLPADACSVRCSCCSRHADVVPIPESLRKLLMAEELDKRRESSS